MNRQDFVDQLVAETPLTRDAASAILAVLVGAGHLPAAEFPSVRSLALAGLFRASAAIREG